MSADLLLVETRKCKYLATYIYQIVSHRARIHPGIICRIDIVDGSFESGVAPSVWENWDEHPLVVSTKNAEIAEIADPDGEPTPLPTRTPHRYEILGFTPNKFGEHG